MRDLRQFVVVVLCDCNINWQHPIIDAPSCRQNFKAPHSFSYSILLKNPVQMYGFVLMAGASSTCEKIFFILLKVNEAPKKKKKAVSSNKLLFEVKGASKASFLRNCSAMGQREF